MQLLIQHPAIYALRCSDCQRWVYDMEKGTRDTYQVGDNEYKYLERTGPPPCQLHWKCPKESPEQASTHELNGRNQTLLEAYWRHRACPDPNPDHVTRELFGLLDGMFRAYERGEQTEVLARILYPKIRK